jgi:hypothetical protein
MAYGHLRSEESNTDHETAQLIYLDAAFVPKNSRLWPS